MSDITNAGFTDVGEGFQVEFIENVIGDANLEHVINGERKVFYDSEVELDTNYQQVKSSVAATETLIVDSDGSHTCIEVGNTEKIFLRVRHTEAAGTCKIIPVGFYSYGSGGLSSGGHTPLGEFSFSASAVYDVDGEDTYYHSHAQEVDTMGFPKIFFLVSDLSASNEIDVWVWPTVPVELAE